MRFFWLVKLKISYRLLSSLWLLVSDELLYGCWLVMKLESNLKCEDSDSSVDEEIVH